MRKNMGIRPPARRRRGRPRLRGGLTDALIARQDAMSRRLARQINDLLANTVPAEVVAYEVAYCRRLVYLVVMGLYDPDVERDPNLPPFVLPPAPDPTLEPVGSLPPSDTLNAARARGASLRGRLIDLQERRRPGMGPAVAAVAGSYRRWIQPYAASEGL
jgi:hypothetical protein